MGNGMPICPIVQTSKIKSPIVQRTTSVLTSKCNKYAAVTDAIIHSADRSSRNESVLIFSWERRTVRPMCIHARTLIQIADKNKMNWNEFVPKTKEEMLLGNNTSAAIKKTEQHAVTVKTDLMINVLFSSWAR